jgi:hypothetical protein
MLEQLSEPSESPSLRQSYHSLLSCRRGSPFLSELRCRVSPIPTLVLRRTPHHLLYMQEPSQSLSDCHVTGELHPSIALLGQRFVTLKTLPGWYPKSP